MISVQNENVIPLSEVANFVPRRRGKPINLSTVYRWVVRGIRGVRLERVQIGGLTYTSVEAIERFFETLTLAANPDADAQRLAAMPPGNTESEVAVPQS